MCYIGLVQILFEPAEIIGCYQWYTVITSKSVFRNVPVCGFPNCEVQEDFGHNLLNCGMGLTSFAGSTSVCIGVSLCLQCSQRLPVSKRGSQYQQHFLKLIFKLHLKGTNKIYKEIHAGVKLECGLCDKY